jgi:hypothetical protein
LLSAFKALHALEELPAPHDVNAVSHELASEVNNVSIIRDHQHSAALATPVKCEPNDSDVSSAQPFKLSLDFSRQAHAAQLLGFNMKLSYAEPSLRAF